MVLYQGFLLDCTARCGLHLKKEILTLLEQGLELGFFLSASTELFSENFLPDDTYLIEELLEPLLVVVEVQLLKRLETPDEHLFVDLLGAGRGEVGLKPYEGFNVKLGTG